MASARPHRFARLNGLRSGRSPSTIGADMSIKAWFPTLIYYRRLERLRPSRLNAELLKECHQIRDYDQEGREWSRDRYPGGYTSYGSLAQLHRMSSTFTELAEKITSHVRVFVKRLDMDLGGRKFEMTDCWINIMPEMAAHSLHLHPLSFISGTYYVQTPKGCPGLKFEDPRLSKFMAAPPKVARCRGENKLHITYPAEAGKLILFESWMRHEVAANRSKAERISISFNYHWG